MSIRDNVMALPPDERLAYALEVLDDLTGVKVEQQAWIMGELGLTAMEAKFFMLLNKSAPAFVSREALLATLWPDGDTDGSMVNVMVHKIRKKGIEIKNHWGMGYSVEKAIAMGEKDGVVVNRWRHWEVQDEEDLILMVQNGSEIRSIAYETDRSERSILDRIRLLKKAGRL